MPHVELPQAEFKVVMLGDTNVGKTSLVLRFAEGYYRDEGRSATVGAFFITKRVQTSTGITCKVQIWDTAGQPQYRKMAPMYYRTAAAAVICYDVTNPKSFVAVRNWVKELQECNATAGNIAIVIAATKRDLLEEPAVENLVSATMATQFAADVGAIFVDTSARNNDNVHLLFQRVSERVLELREQSNINGVNNNNSVTMTPSARKENGKVWSSSSRGERKTTYDSAKRKLNDYNDVSEQNSAKNQSVSTTDEWEEKFREENGSNGLCSTAFAPCASSERGGDALCTIM